jgi:hypothetical protein
MTHFDMESAYRVNLSAVIQPDCDGTGQVLMSCDDVATGGAGEDVEPIAFKRGSLTHAWDDVCLPWSKAVMARSQAGDNAPPVDPFHTQKVTIVCHRQVSPEIITTVRINNIEQHKSDCTFGCSQLTFPRDFEVVSVTSTQHGLHHTYKLQLIRLTGLKMADFGRDPNQNLCDINRFDHCIWNCVPAFFPNIQALGVAMQSETEKLRLVHKRGTPGKTIFNENSQFVVDPVTNRYPPGKRWAFYPEREEAEELFKWYDQIEQDIVASGILPLGYIFVPPTGSRLGYILSTSPVLQWTHRDIFPFDDAGESTADGMCFSCFLNCTAKQFNKIDAISFHPGTSGGITEPLFHRYLTLEPGQTGAIPSRVFHSGGASRDHVTVPSRGQKAEVRIIAFASIQLKAISLEQNHPWPM